MGVPFRCVTTVFSMSRRFWIQPTERMRNSAFPWWTTRPPTDEFERGDGRVHLAEADAVGTKRVRVDIDLILARGPADRGDFRHAGDGVELVADVPILYRAKLTQVLALPFDRVPEDLAEGRRVGGHVRSDTRREERRGDRELLLDSLPAK